MCVGFNRVIPPKIRSKKIGYYANHFSYIILFQLFNTPTFGITTFGISLSRDKENEGQMVYNIFDPKVTK